MNIVNHQFRLATRPVGAVKRSDFTYAGEAVRALADGEVLVRISTCRSTLPCAAG